MLIPSVRESVPLCQHFACKHHLANMALSGKNSIPLLIPFDSSKFDPPLISLSPNSDVALNHFGLGDDLLPCLHALVRTVCSSHWEAILRAAPWSLTFEQASNLSQVLSSDLKAAAVPSTMTMVLLSLFQISDEY